MKPYVFSRIKAIAFAGMAVFLGLASSNSYADIVSQYVGSGLAGIRTPSLPAFGTGVNVTFTKGSHSSTLVASYYSNLNLSILAYDNKVFSVTNTIYSLNATFNSSGVFTGGTVSIKGKINGTGLNTGGTVVELMHATLSSFAKSSSGYLYGFNTTGIVCNPAILAYKGCTQNESVYLALFNSEKSLTKSWSTKGVAITTIPIPAAAWLFGSGLMGLAAVARRKKKTPA
jgi:hypothetical protein